MHYSEGRTSSLIWEAGSPSTHPLVTGEPDQAARKGGAGRDPHCRPSLSLWELVPWAVQEGGPGSQALPTATTPPPPG